MSITTIDSGYTRPQMTAVYLLQSGDEVAIIETATAPQVERIFAELQRQNIALSQVRYIIPTHVHLDHAGAAGVLMQACPEASLLCHPRAQRHLIDPGKLIAGATAVYGEVAMQQLYGEILAIEASRTQVMNDEQQCELGDLKLQFLDTPGHARHHFCVHIEALSALFTGDCTGLAYPELMQAGKPMLFPSTTPVQFDPEAMIQTLERLYALQPRQLYLTHYGAIDATAEVRAQLLGDIDAFVQLTENAETFEALKQSLFEHLKQRVAEHGVRLPEQQLQTLLALDVDLNAQGLMHWKTH